MTTSTVAVGAVTTAPANLRATVTGSAVRLDWDSVTEAVVSHRVEAGSGPGLANLAVLDTGTPQNSLIATAVPAGTYYVRVRAVGPDNVPGPASNEIIVRVGGGCSAAPGAPANFSAQVSGNRVTLSWTPSAAGDAAASYIVEAGSSPGASNVVVFDTGAAAPTVSANAPNGVYYARIRGRNACGVGSASNEFVVQVPGGGTTPPPPPPPPQETPWTPPPAPEPPGPPPPVQVLVPEVTVSVPVVAPPVVVPGPAPRPDRAAGPVVDVAQISAPTPTSRRVRVTASRPIDQVIIAADTRVVTQRVETMAAAESFYLIRLASAQTVVELTLTVTQSFTAQISARLGDNGPVGDYRPASIVTATTAGNRWRGLARITSCSGTGIFDLSGFCDVFQQEYPDFIDLTLNPSGTSVTGTLDFSGLVFPVAGTLTGGQLRLAGQSDFGGYRLGLENWNTTISGPNMTGTFDFVVSFPGIPEAPGSFRLGYTLVSVTSASSATVNESAAPSRLRDVLQSFVNRRPR
jgi:hypothetical protein